MFSAWFYTVLQIAEHVQESLFPDSMWGKPLTQSIQYCFQGGLGDLKHISLSHMVFIRVQ